MKEFGSSWLETKKILERQKQGFREYRASKKPKKTNLERQELGSQRVKG